MTQIKNSSTYQILKYRFLKAKLYVMYHFYNFSWRHIPFRAKEKSDPRWEFSWHVHDSFNNFDWCSPDEEFLINSIISGCSGYSTPYSTIDYGKSK